MTIILNLSLNRLEQFPKKMTKSPGEQLQMYIHSYIDGKGLNENLKSEVPKKWEKYGDFVLFDGRSLSSDEWQRQGEEFWMGVCEILKCKRIALKNRIEKDGYRTPNVKIMIGNDPWITYVDNGIKYSWDVEKNMFCAGNACERHRIGRLDCTGETVVDMFAGIGYFVLPFLMHAKAEFVHAVEWNANAVVALKRNLKLNNVHDRCAVYEGDNCIVTPKGIADRVNLGLIPSSEGSWKRGCEALKPRGGTLHIHGNVETSNVKVTCEECLHLSRNLPDRGKILLATEGGLTIENGISTWKRRQWMIWSIHVLHSLITILRGLDATKKWACSVENVHHVKSYAPHVDHLVLDVLLTNMEDP